MKLGGWRYSSWQSGSPAKPREDFLAAVAVLMEVKDPMGMNRLMMRSAGAASASAPTTPANSSAGTSQTLPAPSCRPTPAMR